LEGASWTRLDSGHPVGPLRLSSEFEDDDGTFEIPSEPPGLHATWSEPPGPGLIPSEPRQSASTVLEFDDGGGTFEIPSEPPGLHATWRGPPGLGLIPSEPHLCDDDDDDGIFDAMSEPPGLGHASIVLHLVEKDGIDESASEPVGLGVIPGDRRLSASTVLDFDDDDGTFVIPSESVRYSFTLGIQIDLICRLWPPRINYVVS
jgi:hypothetical protein